MAAHAGEAKTEAKDAEGNPELLNCKTWVLRFSIDCEGCKKKISKILRRIEGVYRTDIDLKQQRVTVIGNVEVETVISKLEKKTGKRPILLLPDKATIKAKAAQPKEKKQSKPKPEEKQPSNSNNGSSNGGEGEAEGESPKEAPGANDKDEKKAKPKEPEPSNGSGLTDGGSGKSGAAEGKSGGGGEEAKEEKTSQEAKQSMTGLSGGQSNVPEEAAAAAELQVDESEKSAGAGGSATGGKKKKTRGQSGNPEGTKDGKLGPEVSSGDVTVNIERSSPATGPIRDRGLASYAPPHEQFDPYPYAKPYAPHYYHGPPAYAVSYHAAYPTSGHDTSYYAPHPPPNSYSYMHPGQGSERASPYPDHPYALQPSDSFELFSDENPNACSVM